MRTKDIPGTLLLAAGVVAVSAALVSDPRCGRGCRTVLEHITEHVLADILKGI